MGEEEEEERDVATGRMKACWPIQADNVGSIFAGKQRDGSEAGEGESEMSGEI